MDAQSEDGRTALHEAIAPVCLTAVEALSASGASWALVDRFGLIPIDLLHTSVFAEEELRRIRAVNAEAV